MNRVNDIHTGFAHETERFDPMKRTFVGFALLATLTVLTGCNQGTPGGPGATAPTNASGKPPPIGQANDTFNLTVPPFGTSIKQGERKAVSIGIKRGGNFNEDVTLKFAGLPKGVAINPSPALIKHSDESAKLTLIAGENASLGGFSITATGHPLKGADAVVVFKVTVDTK